MQLQLVNRQSAYWSIGAFCFNRLPPKCPRHIMLSGTSDTSKMGDIWRWKPCDKTWLGNRNPMIKGWWKPFELWWVFCAQGWTERCFSGGFLGPGGNEIHAPQKMQSTAMESGVPGTFAFAVDLGEVDHQIPQINNFHSKSRICWKAWEIVKWSDFSISTTFGVKGPNRLTQTPKKQTPG